MMHESSSSSTCLATPRDLLLLPFAAEFILLHACYLRAAYASHQRACIVTTHKLGRMPRQPLGCFSFVLSLAGD